MAFATLMTTAYSIVAFWLPKISLYNKISTLLICLSYVIIFAAAIEYFNLSRHHSKRSLFYVGLAVLWLFIPILGFVTMPLFHNNENYLQYFLAASPIFGSWPVWDVLLTSDKYFHTIAANSIVITLSINIPLALVMALLAKRERKLQTDQILTPVDQPKK